MSQLAQLQIIDTGPSPVAPISISNPDHFNPSFTSLGGVITVALKFIFAAAGIALLLMIISAGFELLSSAGDAKKLESGKQRLTNAVIGFVIIFVAFWITQIAGKIFGIDLIGSTFTAQ
jgi:hypothetical protein